jgi:hypothetical protein
VRRALAVIPSLVLLGCTVGAEPSESKSQASGLLRAWTQLVPGGTAFPGATVPLARAVLAGQGTACPPVTLQTAQGGSTLAMQPRANPLPGKGNYPIVVCEAPLVAPGGKPVTGARIGDVALPLTNAGTAEARIAVIGDTGCRDNKNQKPCKDDKVWPFEELAREIARKRQPTLVVHVGDYRYRQDDKPCDDAGCAEPTWDNWKSWDQDFFEPAAKLLAAAPWVMVRGNHEDCTVTQSSHDGNGRGWFYLLDSSAAALGTTPPQCGSDPSKPTYTAPFAVDVAVGTGDTLRLIVFDSADADDENASPCEPTNPTNPVCVYQGYFATVGQLAAAHQGPSWLVSHRPIWALKKAKCGKTTEVINATLQLAAANLLPGIELAVAGHYHLFESVSWAAGASRPPLVVAGMGGVAISNGPRSEEKASLAGEPVGGAAADVDWWAEHGYLLMRRDAARHAWRPRLYPALGGGHHDCTLSGATFDCGFKAAPACPTGGS